MSFSWACISAAVHSPAVLGDRTAPVITSASSVSVAENTSFSHTLTADEPVTWTKTGGADASLVNLVGSTLSMPAKDYENPSDFDGNNNYEVDVAATDGSGNVTPQSITIHVTDLSDGASPPSFDFSDPANSQNISNL